MQKSKMYKKLKKQKNKQATKFCLKINHSNFLSLLCSFLSINLKKIDEIYKCTYIHVMNEHTLMPSQII